ncbi:MAG: hypothetical protein J6Y78_00680 [Paludibacteraceae bacterium]|nr:hypothetical protein [Paludibacteraceae bacterium]
MQYIPINCNNFTSEFIAPTSVKSINNITFAFWERALFQRAISVLDFTLPDEWEGDVRDFFHYVLFREGRVIVFNYNDYGLIFQPGGLSGFDLYYRPTNALIANPAFSESLDLKIGSDCEVLKLTPDYIGIWDIISYYAEKLSLLDNAINMSLINNKFAFMIGAKNKAAANAIKKMLDLINRGEPAVIYDTRVASDPVDKSEPWNLWERKNLKESYLTTMQLQDFRTIINNFDSEIGIPTIATEKKERMITDEANATALDSKSRVRVWINTFNSSAKKVNSHYGTTISVKLRSDLDGGVKNENNIDSNESV